MLKSMIALSALVVIGFASDALAQRGYRVGDTWIDLPPPPPPTAESAFAAAPRGVTPFSAEEKVLFDRMAPSQYSW